jgi:hypothetical protein
MYRFVEMKYSVQCGQNQVFGEQSEVALDIPVVPLDE